MKISISKEWLESRVDSESGLSVEAGGLSPSPVRRFFIEWNIGGRSGWSRNQTWCDSYIEAEKWAGQSPMNKYPWRIVEVITTEQEIIHSPNAKVSDAEHSEH